MDVKDITQKIIDTYKVAQPFYDNHAPIYGNNTPIYPSYKNLYELIVFLQNNKPDMLLEIMDFIINNPLTLSAVTINYLTIFIPEEHKLQASSLAFMLTVIAEYRKYQWEKHDKSY